jgi:hypothetical protein
MGPQFVRELREIITAIKADENFLADLKHSIFTDEVERGLRASGQRVAVP